MSIADRSLSRLRGSPLPGAGCLGPEIRVGWGLFCLMRTSGPLISRWRVVPPGTAAAAVPPVRFWVGCAAWGSAGCLACVSRWCVYPAGCSCGGFGRRCAFGLAVPLGFGWVLGLCLALVRISCRVQLRRLWPPVRFWVGCAAWDWAGRLAFVSRGCACPAGAQRMLMHRSCAGHCRPFSPLQTIAPSLSGLPA